MSVSKFSLPRWTIRILAAPETNLFLFAFLLHFVYEVWQSPYFEFYGMPTLGDKVAAITHCTFGDGVITLVCFWIVSIVQRSRHWILAPTGKLTLLFTALGWLYTLVSEIYRTRIANFYGLSGLVVPGLEISWLPLLQWLILPPLVLFLAHHQILGYAQKQD